MHLRKDRQWASDDLKKISTLAAMLAIAMVLAMGGSNAPVSASTAVQSSVSAFLTCPISLSFSAQQGGSTCSSGSYKGVYNGVSQAVASTQNSVFYLASATGGVKVNYSLTDISSAKLLIHWVGFGSVSGGTCSSPSVVLPAGAVSGSNSYVINTGATINSGDTIRASLNITFTGTGSPQFCSGGATGTLISIGTTPIIAPGQAILTTTLTAGKAHQTTLLGYTGVSESYIDNGGAGFNALVLGILKDSSGRTVDVISTSISASPGVNVTAFLPFSNYPSGSYTITVLAMTSQFASASTAASSAVVV
jgi:hypothetical protein